MKGEDNTSFIQAIIFTQAQPEFHFSLYSLQLELAKVESYYNMRLPQINDSRQPSYYNLLLYFLCNITGDGILVDEDAEGLGKEIRLGYIEIPVIKLIGIP